MKATPTGRRQIKPFDFLRNYSAGTKTVQAAKSSAIERKPVCLDLSDLERRVSAWVEGQNHDA